MAQIDTRSDQPPPPEEAYDPLKLPAVLVAVGVASMVIAFVTVVANCAGLLTVVGTASMASRIPAYVPPGTPATRPAVLNPQTTPDSQVPPLGLTQSNRKLIVSKLSEMQKLNPSQTLELQYFLLLTGSSVFPSTTGKITEDDIKFQITGSGKHESAGPDDDDYVWFNTQNGKLKLFDTGAGLERGGSSPPIGTSYSMNATTAPAPAYGPLSMTQINVAVRQIKTMWPTPPPLNTAQQNTLIQELKSSSQQLLPPVPNQYPVAAVMVGADGITTINFQGNGQISIDQQGTIVLKRNAPYIPPPYQPSVAGSISQWATTLTVVDSIVSAVLAFLLLIAGIQTLRGSRSGSLLHLIFAWIKLPLAILGLMAAIALSQEMSQQYAASASFYNSPSSSFTPTIILLVALLGAVYPILLLIVFRQPKVWTFYRRVISA